MRVCSLRYLLLLCLLDLKCGAYNRTRQVRYMFGNVITVTTQRRLYGGKLAKEGERPHVVALVDKRNKQLCTGTAIAEYWCLTAGHCTSIAIKYVRYNSLSAVKGGETVRVQAMFRHPEYEVGFKVENGVRVDVKKLHHDVALAKTVGAMKINAPFPKVNPRDVTGNVVDLYGFGKQTDRSGTHYLLTTAVQLKLCSEPDWLHVACGYSVLTHSALCGGDSGGPSFLEGEIVSISSMGPSKCNPSSAKAPLSVVTKVSPYAGMIRNTMDGRCFDALVQVNSAINNDYGYGVVLTIILKNVF